jgi:hypothetical protein
VLAKKPGALRNGDPFRNWDLPPALAQIRRRLAGHDDGDRQFVDILTEVAEAGLDAVEAACAEALAAGLFGRDVVLNILARQRDLASLASGSCRYPTICSLPQRKPEIERSSRRYFSITARPTAEFPPSVASPSMCSWAFLATMEPILGCRSTRTAIRQVLCARSGGSVR